MSKSTKVVRKNEKRTSLFGAGVAFAAFVSSFRTLKNYIKGKLKK